MKEKIVFFQVTEDGNFILLSTPTYFVVYSGRSFKIIAQEGRFGGVRALCAIGRSPVFLFAASGHKPGQSPRKLRVYNSQNRSILHELGFRSSVESCQTNKEVVAVMTETDLSLFDLKTFTPLKTFTHFPGCLTYALSSHTKGLVCYPAEETGSVSLHQYIQKKEINKFYAHKTSLDQMSINREGTLLATSSQTGTIVRVFLLPSGEILGCFRISVLPTKLYSLSFCAKGQYLICNAINRYISLCAIDSLLSKNSLKQPQKHPKHSNKHSNHHQPFSSHESVVGSIRTRPTTKANKSYKKDKNKAAILVAKEAEEEQQLLLRGTGDGNGNGDGNSVNNVLTITMTDQDDGFCNLEYDFNDMNMNGEEQQGIKNAIRQHDNDNNEEEEEGDVLLDDHVLYEEYMIGNHEEAFVFLPHSSMSMQEDVRKGRKALEVDETASEVLNINHSYHHHSPPHNDDQEEEEEYDECDPDHESDNESMISNLTLDTTYTTHTTVTNATAMTTTTPAITSLLIPGANHPLVQPPSTTQQLTNLGNGWLEYLSSPATTNTIVDTTLASWQKMRVYSQDLFSPNNNTNSNNNNSTEEQEKGNETAAANGISINTSSQHVLPIDIDANLHRPIWQGKVNRDDACYTTVLTYATNSNINSNNTIPSSSSQSIGIGGSNSIAPNQQSQTHSQQLGEELKLCLLTDRGIFRRINLEPVQDIAHDSLVMKEITSLIEEERLLLVE